MNSRVTYDEVKSMLLSMYWRGCRSGLASEWTHSEVCSWAYSEFDGAYDLLIEMFMLELSTTILLGSWYPDQIEFHKRRLSDLMREDGFRSEVKGIPQEELECLLADLKIVGLSLTG